MAVLVLTMMRFVMQERAEAVSDWLEGDEAAMVAAERKAAKLVGAWLTWLRCQSVEALPAVRVDMLINPGPGPDLDPGPNPNPNQVRMDMLIKRTGPGAAEVFTLETPHPNPDPHPDPGPHPDPHPDPTPDPNPAHSKVFTLEITELGFSMLAWPAGPPPVFTLALTLTLTLTLALTLIMTRPADGLRRAARVLPRRHRGHAGGGDARPQPHRSGGRRRRRAEWRGCELEHRHHGRGQAAVPPRR